MRRPIAIACLATVFCAPAALGQNLLQNPSFESGTSNWTIFGGGGVNGAGFGVSPTHGSTCYNVIQSFGSTGGALWGIRQTVNLEPGSYTLSADGHAHNKNQFAYIPGDPSTDPEATIVQLGVDLTGGTDPSTAVLGPEVNTGANWQTLTMNFTVTEAGPVTIFLITRQDFNLAGNWSAFDRASLILSSACVDPSTVDTVTPNSITVPPPAPNNQQLTITGTNLDQVTAVRLQGAANIPGSIQSQTPTQIVATFDLVNRPFGTYDLIVERDAPCPEGVKNAAFTINCTCPESTLVAAVDNKGLSGDNAHVVTLIGNNLDCLTQVKLKKTRGTGAEIIGTNLTMVGGNLQVTFDLTDAEAGRYNIQAGHPCNLVSPLGGLNEGFLVYVEEITNGSFEEGYAPDNTTGSVCEGPGANGNRPFAKHWDVSSLPASGLGGPKRDGNVHYPECDCGPPPCTGNVKNVSGVHYAGFDVITSGSFPINTVSFFQTIAAPNVDVNGVSTAPYNVRAEFAINGGAPAYPVTAQIRLLDGTEEDGIVLATATIPSKYEQDGDGGLVADPNYNAIIEAATVYQSQPPLLTIEFRFTTAATSPPNTPYGFWVDNVRTGGFSPPNCSQLIWADSDNDGDVDHDDFGLFQLCYTGPSFAISPNPPGCTCFDRNSDDRLTESDFNEFKNCVSGASVPWSPAVAPNCVP